MSKSSYERKWGLGRQGCNKTFADTTLFWELPEWTADAKEEWRLFRTTAISSAARICGQN